ncbi:MAG: hypothetical protein MUE46_04610 [Xanthomonadales bacterium]|jgi:hypothetical protein|nr:hypothetical protein [Xanthomonadales bacterium]
MSSLHSHQVQELQEFILSISRSVQRNERQLPTAAGQLQPAVVNLEPAVQVVVPVVQQYFALDSGPLPSALSAASSAVVKADFSTAEVGPLEGRMFDGLLPDPAFDSMARIESAGSDGPSAPSINDVGNSDFSGAAIGLPDVSGLVMQRVSAGEDVAQGARLGETPDISEPAVQASVVAESDAPRATQSTLPSQTPDPETAVQASVVAESDATQSTALPSQTPDSEPAVQASVVADAECPSANPDLAQLGARVPDAPAQPDDPDPDQRAMAALCSDSQRAEPSQHAVEAIRLREDELQRARASQSHFELELASRDQLILQLDRELAQIAADRDTLRLEVEGLRAELVRQVSEYQRQIMRTAALEADLNESRDQMTQALVQTKQLESKLAMRQADHELSLGLLSSARESLERANAERDTVRGDLISVRLALSAEQRAREAAESRIALAKAERIEAVGLRVELGRKAEQIEKAAALADELTAARAQTAQLEAKLAMLQADHEANLVALSSAQESLGRVSPEHEAILDELAKLRLALNAEQSAREAAEARAVAAEAALSESSAVAAPLLTPPAAARPPEAATPAPPKRVSPADGFLSALPSPTAPARPATPTPVMDAALPAPSPEWIEREKRRLQLLARPTSEVPAKLYFHSLPWTGLQPSGVLQIRADLPASDPARAIGSFAAGAATRQAIDESHRGSGRPLQ